jgi:hypothetical protein
MTRKIRFAVALFGLWALFGSNSAKATWVKVEPADAGFSVFLPVTPTMAKEEKPGAVGRTWVARAANILCVIGVTDYSVHVDAEQELELDMKNFLKAIEGTATAKQKVSFRDAPDGPLPALRFSFNRTGWTGQSLVVVAGDRSYMAAALGSPGSDPKDVARCLAFKVTAKSRHYQTP